MEAAPPGAPDPGTPAPASVVTRLVAPIDGVPPPPPSPGRAVPDVPPSGGASTAKVVGVLGLVLVAVVAVSAASVGALASLRSGTVAASGSPGTSEGAPAACDVDEGWTCATLDVPVRHGTAGGTTTIAYAVHRATAPGPDRRVMVYAAGGPGASGIDDARWLVDQLDPAVVAAVDLVTFDPRGTGRSGYRDCIRAWEGYRASDEAEAAIRSFVDDCLGQARAKGLDLAMYGTAEIAEDIEAIRVDLGVPRISLYGSSYGTVTAQAYAAAHPDRVTGLVLDAPLDRTLAPADLWVEAARGYGDALEATFDACTADPDCREAMPDAAGTYRRLLERLERDGTIAVKAYGPAGRLENRSFSRAGLDDMTSAAMYSTSERSSFLRALAAYEAGDARLLGRLVEALAFDGYGTFAYFATWCADARVAPAGSEGLDAYRRVAADAGVDAGAAASTADALAPCAFWPSQPASWTAPADPGDVPTLVLGASLDPVTRLAAARSIAARIDGARLVETRGGDHGNLGRSCPQAHVTRLLVEGVLPDRPTSLCVISTIDWFIPLAPRPAATASDAVVGVLWDLAAAPELAYWDGERITVGCAEGGTATLVDRDAGWAMAVSFDGCAAAAGLAFDGQGTFDPWSFDADIRVRAEPGELHLVWTSSAWHLDGTWRGAPIDEDF